MKIGYARVSTGDQHPESQEERLRAAGCETVFTDRVSGAKASRPEWDRCLASLQAGDVLVAVKLDRFGRSVRNLADVAEDLRSRGVDMACLDQPIDTSGAMGQLVYTMLSAFAEFERALLIERTRDGMESRRAAGAIMGGRPAFGWKLRDGKLIRDEAALKVAAEVFRRSAEGQSTAMIAAFIRSNGYRRRANTVADLLRNPVYVEEGIVSAALARAAVSALEGRRTGPVRQTSGEDYSGFLTCVCGRVMHRILAGGKVTPRIAPTRYYRCREHEGRPLPMVRGDDSDALIDHIMENDWWPYLIPVRRGGDSRDAELAKLHKARAAAKTRAETDAIWDEIERVQASDPEPERTEWLPSGKTRGEHWASLTIPERRAWLGSEDTKLIAWNADDRAPLGSVRDGAWANGRVRIRVQRAD